MAADVHAGGRCLAIFCIRNQPIEIASDMSFDAAFDENGLPRYELLIDADKGQREFVFAVAGKKRLVREAIKYARRGLALAKELKVSPNFVFLTVSKFFGISKKRLIRLVNGVYNAAQRTELRQSAIK